MTPDHARKIETCARRIRILVDAGQFWLAAELARECSELLREPERIAA